MKFFSILAIIVFLFIQFPCRSQQFDLTKEEPSWQTVISGSPVAQPLKTTYGFVVITDGHQITACSDEGVVLWQQSIKGFPTPYNTVARGDFLYVVTSENKLNLINPSGKTLWSEYMPFDEIIAPPVAGADGRMFVQGKSQIACYGLNGKMKWISDVGEMECTQLFTLNDGSVLALLQKTDGGNSVGIRLSPFGEKIEEMTFGGKIAKAVECEQGLFMAFEDGSAGLCKVKDNIGKSGWFISATEAGFGRISANTIFLSSVDSLVCASVVRGGNAEIILFDTDKLEIQNRFDVSSTPTDTGFFEMDRENIYIAGKSVSSYSLSGEISWEAKIPSSNEWEYIFYMDSGHLSFTARNNWVIKGFRVFQAPRNASRAKPKEQTINYDAFLTEKKDISGYSVKALDTADYNKIMKKLQDGDYSDIESKWIPIIKNEAKDMAEYYISHDELRHDNTSVFKSDIVYQKQLCNLMAAFGSSIFNKELILLLHNVTDKQMLNYLLQTVAVLGYDEDGSILREIEFVATKRALPDDFSLLTSCADATYSICRVMGRPALYSRGKKVLAYMLYPQYTKKIREYSRKKLEDIIKLGI